jgi:DNA-binding CsgD family transcriptional regulator
MLAFTGYVIVKKKIQSIIYTFILTLSVAFNIVIWLLEQLVHIDFEILSVSYIITELFLLVLFYLMDEGYSPLSVSNPSPSIIPVENSPSFSFDQDTVSNSPSDTSSAEDTSAVVEAAEFADSNMALSNETAKIEFFISHLESLTPAEQKIYHLYLQKKSTREILNELCITENTLKYHNKNLYGKLGVSSRKELFAIASKLPCESPNSNQ